MNPRIEWLNPATAPQADLIACADLRIAAFGRDSPGDPAPSRAAVIGQLRRSLPEFGATRHLATRAGADIVGTIAVGLPADENAHVAFVDLTVHPTHRRQGIGTALLRAAVDPVIVDHRSAILAAGLRHPGNGEQWCLRRGFVEAKRDTMLVLDLTTVDRDRWATPAPRGYRLHGWTGTTPGEFTESFARTRRSIEDAPHGRLSFRRPAWSAERVREAERALRVNGVESWIVAAVHAADGLVTAFTEVRFLPHRPDQALQGDTVVDPRHRGNGLGRAVKAAMAERIADRRPAIARLYTTCDVTNRYMIDINLALGYRPERTVTWLEADADTLRRQLDG